MPRAEWPVDYNVFTREKTGNGRFPGPWDADERSCGRRRRRRNRSPRSNRRQQTARFYFSFVIPA